MVTLVSLPIEIIIDEIFPRLPAKSLVRFKCISKYYNNLISSPEFIDLHLRQSLSSDANSIFILVEAYSVIYTFDVDSSPPCAIFMPLPRTKTLETALDYGGVSIVGSCNGLLCLGLEWQYEESGTRFEYMQVVINPSTGVYWEIPYNYAVEMDWRSLVSFGFGFGFGFDDENLDYKVVMVVENVYLNDGFYYQRVVMVYSLKESSWELVEKLGETDTLVMAQKGVLLRNHILHFVFKCSTKYCIYLFDIRSNEWGNEVPLMDLITHPMINLEDDEKDKMVHAVNLGVLHGCLCLSTVSNLSRAIWIMKEYGVKESWVKLFDQPHGFGPGPFNFCSSYVNFCFYQGLKDEVLVRKKGEPGLWCNVGPETCSKTEEMVGGPFEEACFLKGSLVSIPGGQKIKIPHKKVMIKEERSWFKFNTRIH